jgi:hypothetical protein
MACFKRFEWRCCVVNLSSERVPCATLHVSSLTKLFYPLYGCPFESARWCLFVSCYSSKFPEPTNNVPPKKDLERFEGHQILIVPNGGTSWLTCLVTGYPVPRYM